MLRLMLDRHPRLAVPSESYFIPTLWRRRRRYGPAGMVRDPAPFLADLERQLGYRLWELPAEAVAARVSPGMTLSDAIEEVFGAYAAHRGKEWWGDMTPNYVNHLPLLERLFPQARFVHLVRDGRNVALSVLDLGRLHRQAATPAFYWARAIRRGRRAQRRLGDRYTEVRYEDLVADPERELRRLCEFLSIPYHPAVVEHDPDAAERVPDQVRHMHTRVSLPPTRGLRDWRTQMSAADLRGFEAVAGRTLDQTGYPRSGVEVGWRDAVGARARLVAFRTRVLLRLLRKGR